MNVSKLVATCLDFRICLEQYLLDNPAENISTNFLSAVTPLFPDQCCKGASHILGQFLVDHFHLSGIKYVWGQRDNDTHGWLEWSNLIVDITADQFSEITEKILVLEKSKSDFHKSFKKQSESEFDLSSSHLFNRISKLIRKACYTDSNDVVK